MSKRDEEIQKISQQVLAVVETPNRADAMDRLVKRIYVAESSKHRLETRLDVAESELADLRMANRECQEVASRNAADAAHLRQTAITLETELAALRERVERAEAYLQAALEALRGR